MKDPSKLHNKAIGGRSAKSFKAEGRWQGIVDELKRGDFVIVAFGHNDANKAKTDRYSTLADYAEAVKAVAAKKGVPVVDLNDASYRMHAKMGVKGSRAIQCNNRGKIDNTHHNIYGS